MGLSLRKFQFDDRGSNAGGVPSMGSDGESTGAALGSSRVAGNPEATLIFRREKLPLARTASVKLGADLETIDI